MDVGQLVTIFQGNFTISFAAEKKCAQTITKLFPQSSAHIYVIIIKKGFKNEFTKLKKFTSLVKKQIVIYLSFNVRLNFFQIKFGAIFLVFLGLIWGRSS